MFGVLPWLILVFAAGVVEGVCALYNYFFITLPERRALSRELRIEWRYY